MLYAYPCILKPETEEGSEHWFNVSFPDVPEALTCGEGEQKALEMAQDAVSAALAGYVKDRCKIPEPGKPRKGQFMVALLPVVAVKIALYRAMRSKRVTAAVLAKRLGVTPEAAEKITNPDNRSHMAQAQRALKLMGCATAIDDLAA